MPKKYIVPLCLIVFVVTLGGLYFFFSKSENNSQNDNNASQLTVTPTPTPEPEPVSVNSKTLMFGDVFVGRRVDDWAQASELKYAYPFSGLNTFSRDDYDSWMANFECPSTDGSVTDYQEEKLLKFNCKPAYLVEAAKWFDVFSLANNHTDNMGANGLITTREKMELNGIQYFGHYNNAVKEDICEVVTIDARLKFQDGTQKEGSVPIVMCGYHGVFKLPTDSELAVIKDYAKYLPVITMPHQGAEYQQKSDNYKRVTFRKMIDNGADLVIGGHPHTVQETEAYKDKLIVYSVGNFIFDQQWKQDVILGIGIEAEFEFTYDDNMEKWMEIAEDCKAYKDDCLKQAESLGLTKPTYKIKYGMVTSNSGNKLTKLGSEQDRQVMLSRTKFNETISKLP